MELTLTEPATTERVVTDEEIRRRAADLLEEFGWCQGAFARDPSGSPYFARDKEAVAFCARGALIRAGLALGLASNWADLAQAQITEQISAAIFCRLDEWNDDPGRTKAEVVALLRGTE